MAKNTILSGNYISLSQRKSLRQQGSALTLVVAKNVS